MLANKQGRIRLFDLFINFRGYPETGIAKKNVVLL